MKTILITVLLVYLVGCFATYFFFCYKSATKNYKTGKYKTDIDEAAIMAMIFWPLLLVILAIISPFKLIEKFAIKIKEVANREKINVEKLTGTKHE